MPVEQIDWKDKMKQIIEIEWKEFNKDNNQLKNGEHYFVKFADENITVASYYYNKFWPIHVESTYSGCGECVFYDDIILYGAFDFAE